MRRRQMFAAQTKSAWHEMAERIDDRPVDISELSDSILADMFCEAFGRQPHGKMKRATILDRLKMAVA